MPFTSETEAPWGEMAGWEMQEENIIKSVSTMGTII